MYSLCSCCNGGIEDLAPNLWCVTFICMFICICKWCFFYNNQNTLFSINRWIRIIVSIKHELRKEINFQVDWANLVDQVRPIKVEFMLEPNGLLKGLIKRVLAQVRSESWFTKWNLNFTISDIFPLLPICNDPIIIPHS